MPRYTETCTLGDERARLDARLDELADQAMAGDDVGSEPADVEQQLAGVLWGIQEYGGDASFTFGALTTAEYRAVTQTATRLQSEKDSVAQHTDGQGSHTSVYIAAGVVDAPFVEEVNGEKQNGILDLVAVVDAVQPQFSEWLETRVDDLTSVDAGNVRSFNERLNERASETTDGSAPST